jgi:hypothetical protein
MERERERIVKQRQNSAVGIVTGYGLDNKGLEFES